MNVSPDYLADTLRRIEARRAAKRPPQRPRQQVTRQPRIVGWYGTVTSVDQVDRRPRRQDPTRAVDSVINGLVDEYLGTSEPDENEVEDATIGNELLLRGIPTTGVGGTMKNTDPLRTILSREKHKQRRPRLDLSEPT